MKLNSYSVLAFAFLVMFTMVSGVAVNPANAGTTFTATGTVFDTYTTGGVDFLKIQKADGTKAAADCTMEPIECGLAELGSVAWGRGSCMGGNCSWACLDVENPCSEPGMLFQVLGEVVGKETCAGHMYLTIALTTGGDSRAECKGALWNTCNNLAIGADVYGILELKCGEPTWTAAGPR